MVKCSIQRLLIGGTIVIAALGQVSRVTVLADSTVPYPWTSDDVGDPQLAGDARYSDGTFVISGAGADIWGPADSFQFVHTPIDDEAAGDQSEIVARVTSIQNT